MGGFCLSMDIMHLTSWQEGSNNDAPLRMTAHSKKCHSFLADYITVHIQDDGALVRFGTIVHPHYCVPQKWASSVACYT